MKTDIEILFERFRNELPRIKSKNFLAWAKEKYPNLDLHHLLASSSGLKFTDLLIVPLEHWTEHPEAHENLKIAFEKHLPTAIKILMLYVEFLEQKLIEV